MKGQYYYYCDKRNVWFYGSISERYYSAYPWVMEEKMEFMGKVNVVSIPRKGTVGPEERILKKIFKLKQKWHHQIWNLIIAVIYVGHRVNTSQEI